MNIDESQLKDFLTFRRMITPIIIQIVFWALAVIVFFAGLVSLIWGDDLFVRVGGFVAMILGPLFVRVYAEILIIIFRINETLIEIRNQSLSASG